MHFPSRKKIILVFILIQLLVLPIILFAVKKQQETRSRADLSQDVEINTKKLLSDTGTETEQISISLQRKNQMLALGKQNPDKFLLNVVSDELKTALPISAQDNIEKRIEVQGFITESITEEEGSVKEKTAPSLILQELDSEGFVKNAYTLYLREGQIPNLGEKVLVKGYLIENLLIPISITPISSSAQSLGTNSKLLTITNPTRDVLGVSTVGNNKKIAVIMVNFKPNMSDVSGQFTSGELSEIYFTGNPSTTKYLKSMSFNKLSFTGDIEDVYGWITLTNFSRKDACDINEEGPGKGFIKAAVNKAKAQARERGNNFDEYEFIGFIFPYASGLCSWGSAIASGIAGVDSDAKPYHFLNGDYCAHSVNCNSKDKKFYAALMAHEMGHNLGLSHANGLDCGAKIVDSYNKCRSITYADRFDLAGGAWTYFPFPSSYNQITHLGWIPEQNRKTVTRENVTADGVYKLYSLSRPREQGQTEFIRIPRTVNDGAYYIEYRSKESLDSDFPANVFKGAIIRLSDIPNGVLTNEDGNLQYRPEQTYLLDLSNSNPASWADFLNPTLKDGKSFEDTINRIKITQISHDETQGTVDLKIDFLPPPCLKESPKLIITEPSLNGNPGEKLRYEMKLTSNDSTTCPNATFDFTAVNPSGWTVSFPQNGIAIAPNQTITLYADITSPASANIGGNPYIFQITAKNRVNATFARTKEARYNIIQTAPSPTPTRVPAPTPTPTRIQTPTPTRVTTPTPTRITTPTPTHVLTPTPSPNPAPSTTLNFTSIKLHGIGKGGDNVNPNGTGNVNPLTPTRSLTVELYNASGALVASAVGNIAYSSATGDFTGTITLPTTIDSGSYLAKIKSSQFLRRQLPGVVNIVKGTTNQGSGVSLVTGDINGDQKLTFLDFGILKGCYSDLLPPKDCTPAKKAASDITDDGKVNQDDFSLYIRELSVVTGD